MSVVSLSELGKGLTTVEVQTATAAAIAAACAPGGAIYNLVNPDTGPLPAGPFTGSNVYTVVAGSAGFYASLSGLLVTANMDVTLGIRSSGGASIGSTFGAKAGQVVVLAPTSRLTYKSNLDEALQLTCNVAGATLTVTYWGGPSL